MKKKILKLIQNISIMTISILTVILILSVRRTRGNAREINYAGIVRGGTQKLVKEELHGMQNDALMVRLDNILYSLKTGKGTFKISKIPDRNYQEKLGNLSTAWEDLKAEIDLFRTDKTREEVLFQKSEEYFVLADQTVEAAQIYAENTERLLRIMEWIILAAILCNAVTIILYGRELEFITQNNEKLNQVTYTDACTGLSNQRKCTERLADKAPIPADSRITCFMFDLNNLKTVNDQFGHEAGDQLIAGFGEALRKEALAHMFLGRKGGDEFIAISVNAEEPEVESFLKRIKSNCEARLVAGQKISYATGTAVSTDFPGKNISDLMDVADKRMYGNKKLMKHKKA